jgi:hypothetical protein
LQYNILGHHFRKPRSIQVFGLSALGTVSDVRREQRRWPEIEEARRPMEAKTKMEKPVGIKRWRRAVSAVLAAVVVTAPPLVILLGGRGFRAPGVWIQTAMAGLRKGKQFNHHPP